MSLEQDKQHAFDSYCKRIVKNEAVSVHREYQQQKNDEVLFSDLTEKGLRQLQYTDQYAPSRRTFPLLGMDVEIVDGNLARALASLTPDRRAIVMLSYLVGMRDLDIAQLLHVNRSTVQYRRASILEELRTIMEGYENE